MPPTNAEPTRARARAVLSQKEIQQGAVSKGFMDTTKKRDLLTFNNVKEPNKELNAWLAENPGGGGSNTDFKHKGFYKPSKGFDLLRAWARSLD